MEISRKLRTFDNRIWLTENEVLAGKKYLAISKLA
jgi:hypothetical protein